MNDEPLQLVEQTLALCPPGIFQCIPSDDITGDNDDQSHLKVRTSLSSTPEGDRSTSTSELTAGRGMS